MPRRERPTPRPSGAGEDAATDRYPWPVECGEVVERQGHSASERRTSGGVETQVSGLRHQERRGASTDGFVLIPMVSDQSVGRRPHDLPSEPVSYTHLT